MITATSAGAAGQPTGLASDVRHYLSQSPRQLPSSALYDTLGSALFDAICELPWYPLTRAERRLLAMHRDEILREARSPGRVVELGGGNGSKLDLLLGDPHHARYVRRIELVDVSASALRDAQRRLTEQRTVTVTLHAMRYEQGLAAIARSPMASERTLAVFLGSNVGNFDPPGAERLLKQMCTSLRSGDALLIGVDLVKPEDVLLRAYDDPLGVTAAFNKNLLVHLNRELGATFDVEAFDHRAVWNPAASRVEMHLVGRSKQRVAIPASGLAVTLEAGESIWTESSYKYREVEFDRILRTAGFTPVRHWVDVTDGFLLALARV